MAVDREFVYIVLAPSLGFGSFCLLLSLLGAAFGPFWDALGRPWAPFGSLWAALGSPVAPFGPFWDALGRPWAPFGSLWAALGSPVAPSRKILENWASMGGPKVDFSMPLCSGIGGQELIRGIPGIPRHPRKWCHQLQLGTSLPHAPGVRMT